MSCLSFQKSGSKLASRFGRPRQRIKNVRRATKLEVLRYSSNLVPAELSSCCSRRLRNFISQALAETRIEASRKTRRKIFSIFIFLKQEPLVPLQSVNFSLHEFFPLLIPRRFKSAQIFFRNNLATFHPSSSFSLTLFPLSSTFPSLEIFSQSFLYLHNLYNIQFLHNSNLPQKNTLER